MTKITITKPEELDKRVTKIENDEISFDTFKTVAEATYQRVSCCTSCDDDFVDDSLFSELSPATLLYNHFCDRYVVNQDTPYEHLSLERLIEHYDRCPEYEFAYLMTFNKILEKYHASNTNTDQNRYIAF